MAKLGFTIDPTKENLNQGHVGLPVGLKIPVEIKKVALEYTRDKKGGKMVFTVGIFDGPFKGREAAMQFNVVNNSPDAQRIGREQVAKIGVCVGISAPIENTEQFKPGAKFLVDTEAKELDSGAVVGEPRRVFALGGQQPGEVLNLIKAGKFKEAATFTPAKFAQEWAAAAEAPTTSKANQEEEGGWGEAPPKGTKTAAKAPAKPKPLEPEENPWGDAEEAETAEQTADEPEAEAEEEGFSWGE